MKKTIAIMLIVLIALFAFTSCQDETAGADAIDTYLAYAEAENAFYTVCYYPDKATLSVDFSNPDNADFVEEYLMRNGSSIEWYIEEALRQEYEGYISYEVQLSSANAKGLFVYERTTTNMETLKATGKSSFSDAAFDYTYTISNRDGSQEPITGKGTFKFSYSESVNGYGEYTNEEKTTANMTQESTRNITVDGKVFSEVVEKYTADVAGIDTSNWKHTNEIYTVYYGGVEVDSRLLDREYY